MSIFYVIMAIVVVLGLVVGQTFVLQRKGLEYATASLQALALRPRIGVRMVLATLASIACLVIAGCVLHFRPVAAYSGFVFFLLFCLPAVIFFFFVPRPPSGLIAAFGTAMARVIWSVIFGFTFSLIFFVYVEFCGGAIP